MSEYLPAKNPKLRYEMLHQLPLWQNWQKPRECDQDLPLTHRECLREPRNP